jgi:Ser/Thr protein kinase RdoA (MazF antagonist)
MIAAWVERHYPLTAPVVDAVLDRGKNTLVRLISREGAHWLRLATGVDVDLADAEAEALTVATLRERGLRVSSLRKRRGGTGYAATFEAPPCTSLLFGEVPGLHVEAPTPVQMEALGQLIAEVHSAAVPVAVRPRTRQIDRSLLADEPLRAVEPHLKRHGLDAGALRATADEMAMMLRRLDAEAIAESVLCHGDLRLENLRFEGDAPSLFDFEIWGVGSALYDLACFWRKDVQGLDEPFATERWDALLRGYRKTRPLEPSRLRAVPAWATLRAISVMCMPALPRANWGRDWLSDREYFEAHLSLISRYCSLASRE